jgi:hypothetical protein
MLNEIKNCQQGKDCDEKKDALYQALDNLPKTSFQIPFDIRAQISMAFGEADTIIRALNEDHEAFQDVLKRYADYRKQVVFLNKYSRPTNNIINIDNLVDQVAKELSDGCQAILKINTSGGKSPAIVDKDKIKECMIKMDNETSDKLLNSKLDEMAKELDDLSAKLATFEEGGLYHKMERFKYLMQKKYEKDCGNQQGGIPLTTCETTTVTSSDLLLERTDSLIMIGQYLTDEDNANIDTKLKNLCKTPEINQIASYICGQLQSAKYPNNPDNTVFSPPGHDSRGYPLQQPENPEVPVRPPSREAIIAQMRENTVPGSLRDIDKEAEEGRPLTTDELAPYKRSNKDQRTSRPTRSFSDYAFTGLAAGVSTALPFGLNYLQNKAQIDNLGQMGMIVRQRQISYLENCIANPFYFCNNIPTSYPKFQNEMDTYNTNYLAAWNNYWNTTVNNNSYANDPYKFYTLANAMNNPIYQLNSYSNWNSSIYGNTLATSLL